MTDFGNNRLVRFEPGTDTEKSWTLFDPTIAILSPSQIQFDPQGRVWISEFTGARMDRLDPESNQLVSFLGFLNPIHFDLFAGRVYVTEANGSNGQIALLDPGLATATAGTIEPEILEVRAVVNSRRAIVRDYTITPTTLLTRTSLAFQVTPPSVEWKTPRGGRIVHHDPAFLARLQDNEMIHVPVQDSRETQLAQMVNLDSQRPACQAQVSRYLHEGLKAGDGRRLVLRYRDGRCES